MVIGQKTLRQAPKARPRLSMDLTLGIQLCDGNFAETTQGLAKFFCSKEKFVMIINC